MTTGLTYHLDASQGNSLSSTANGAAVSAWNDTSGHGVNFLQSNAANQPTYTAAAINGLALNFIGASTSAASSFLTSGSTSVGSIFIVNEPTITTSANAVLWSCDSTTGVAGIYSDYWNNNVWLNNAAYGFTGSNAYGIGGMAINGGSLATNQNVAFGVGATQVL